MRAYYFDCLRRERGQPRRAADARTLRRVVAQSCPAAQLIPRLVTRVRDEAAAFYDAAVAQGHEGLMAKSLDAPYEAGNRGASWLKIKRVAHPRSRGARGGMGAWPPPGQVVESASWRARSGHAANT